MNITLGPPVERMMISGLHTVEDIFCCSCGQLLGWKYVSFNFAPGLLEDFTSLICGWVSPEINEVH